jgi:hydroxymethylpyrimidine pyrophosphatase-like HAD family hydrolase
VTLATTIQNLLMKLCVLALDYDGTIAINDRPDSSVLAAIAEARSNGVKVLLVTGRILSELRRVADDLRFVDAVVAENGAVVYFPDSGHRTVLGQPVNPALTARLAELNIAYQAGECLIDADATAAPAMLDVIHALELPVVLLFNRSRVMALAQGISKATGLTTVLNMLRASPRNTVAIGDAENDHELLRVAEIGAAVAWGSRSLQAAADIVISGASPAAVGDFIRRLAATVRLPNPDKPRRRLPLGRTEDGREFSLGVRGRNMLITGDTNSGKSWLAGLLCERQILHGYSLCVIDPEGDYRTLDALPGVTVLGGDDPFPTPRDLLHALRYPDRSLVIDLSSMSHGTKRDYIRSVLPALNVMRRRTGVPHRIVIDEAHYFLHDALEHQLLDLDVNGYTVVTYWPSQLPAGLIGAAEVILVTRESNAVEIEALRLGCTTCQQLDSSGWDLLPHLRLDQAAALPGTQETKGKLQVFTIGERLTPHVRHRQKYVDVPVADSRAFVFTRRRDVGTRARTLREFVAILESIALTEADPYLRRGDFARWIDGVFGDHALAQELQRVERRYGETKNPDVLKDITAAIRSRYDLAVQTAA